jgi:hypothetical protein
METTLDIIDVALDLAIAQEAISVEQYHEATNFVHTLRGY